MRQSLYYNDLLPYIDRNRFLLHVLTDSVEHCGTLYSTVTALLLTGAGLPGQAGGGAGGRDPGGGGGGHHRARVSGVQPTSGRQATGLYTELLGITRSTVLQYEESSCIHALGTRHGVIHLRQNCFHCSEQTFL
jgi:hypothetical protein